MRHPQTRTILAHWLQLRGDRRAPLRQDINPRDFARGLAHLGLLQRAGRDSATVRLAGTGICGLFGRELKSWNFAELWSQGARLSVQTALQRVLALGQAIVIEAYGDTESGRTLPMEVLLMPLAGEPGQVSQILIFVQPLEATATLLGEPLKRLRFIAMQQADTAQPTVPQSDDIAGPNRGPSRGHLRLVASRDLPAATRTAEPALSRWQGALHAIS